MLLIEVLNHFSPHGPSDSLRIMLFREQNKIQRITMKANYVKT